MNDYFEIEKNVEDSEEHVWHVFCVGIYGDSSVLAGTSFRRLVAGFHVLLDAQREYPTADVVEAYRMEPPAMPDIDPNPQLTADAGECWDEY